MKIFPVQGLSVVLYYLKIKGIVNKAVCQTVEMVRNNIVSISVPHIKFLINNIHKIKLSIKSY